MKLSNLTTQWLGQSHRHLESVDSTNDYLKRRAHALPHGATVTASCQTKGKGRLGKTWSQEQNRGLALSILLHHIPPHQLSLLPLVAGLSVCKGIRQLCGLECKIKWSNDILLGEFKVCGILSESRLAPSGTGFAVVGIGVNLTQTTEEFSRLGLVYANSLFGVTQKLFTQEQTATAILNELEPLLEQLYAEGFASLRDEYRKVCVTLGRPVRVIRQGKEQVGTALDIAEDGSLLCEIGGQAVAVNAGEASVRGLFGYSP